ncbi:MAG: glycerophosphodiester phosphodiesterase [Pseudomonadota bacterium]|nr:glycerophosphodiester phosphodiesterase [Pseudomonadota bacterium]
MEIIAHRGASAHAPENTLAAFRLAWEHGADGIEMDVHLSRDGRVKVHHDPTTLRCAGADYSIALTDSAVLRDLDVGRWWGEGFAGERMPFLEEALEALPPGRRALIEIKCGAEIVPALGRAVARADGRCRIGVIAMDLDVLLGVREALPQMPVYWVVGCDVDQDGVFPPHPPGLIAIARRHGLTGLDPDYRGIDAGFAAAVRAAGLKLIAWTVNDPAAARRLRDLGLEAITTDRPREIRAALANG